MCKFNRRVWFKTFKDGITHLQTSKDKNTYIRLNGFLFSSFISGALSVRRFDLLNNYIDEKARNLGLLL